MATVFDNDPGYSRRHLPVYWYLLVALLFLLLRLPKLGHLLTLDEAWILCALRSMKNGGGLFIEQFWRHPPIFMGLGMLLSPTGKNFEVRLELLGVTICLAALLMFLKLVGRYFGRRVAISSGVAYALLPGPIFFDTWIKRDCLVSLLGILTVWAVLRKRHWLAGAFLGLAFLSKETAVYYAVA